MLPFLDLHQQLPRVQQARPVRTCFLHLHQMPPRPQQAVWHTANCGKRLAQGQKTTPRTMAAVQAAPFKGSALLICTTHPNPLRPVSCSVDVPLYDVMKIFRFGRKREPCAFWVGGGWLDDPGCPHVGAAVQPAGAQAAACLPADAPLPLQPPRKRNLWFTPTCTCRHGLPDQGVHGSLCRQDLPAAHGKHVQAQPPARARGAAGAVRQLVGVLHGRVGSRSRLVAVGWHSYRTAHRTRQVWRLRPPVQPCTCSKHRLPSPCHVQVEEVVGIITIEVRS